MRKHEDKSETVLTLIDVSLDGQCVPSQGDVNRNDWNILNKEKERIMLCSTEPRLEPRGNNTRLITVKASLLAGQPVSNGTLPTGNLLYSDLKISGLKV